MASYRREPKASKNRGSALRVGLLLPSRQAVTLGPAPGDPAEVEPLGCRFLASGSAWSRLTDMAALLLPRSERRCAAWLLGRGGSD